jgi:hypothetical protein
LENAMMKLLPVLAATLALGLAACEGGIGPYSNPTTPPSGAAGVGGAAGTGGQVMGPSDIRERLRASGFTDVSEMTREGGFYKGTGYRGTQRYAFTVDARTGQIDSSPY